MCGRRGLDSFCLPFKYTECFGKNGISFALGNAIFVVSTFYMEDFIVSARKYRPLSFDNVVGQLHITGTLRNALTNKKIPHALLFCGPRGVGKTTCARILAKSINCMKPSPEMEPCGTCDSCVGFQTSHSFNIHELDAASNNSVEGIRDLIGQVRIPPQVGSHSVYIIDEVHMLSAAAFNAFLKTLEEPPAHAVFILATTEKHKILPTILSRCQIFDFRRITVDDITGHLMKIAMKEGIEAEEGGLHVIAMKADGALRDALSIFDRIVTFSGNRFGYKEVIENLNILDYDYHFQLLEMGRTNQTDALLLKLDEILQLGFDGAYLLGGLCEHLRNLLVVHSPATVKLLEATDALRERYVQQSNFFSLETKLAILDLMNTADAQYRLANNKRLHLELSLLKLAAFLQNGPQGPGHDSRQPSHSTSEPAQNPSTSTSNNTSQSPLNHVSTKSKFEAEPSKPSPANPPPPHPELTTNSVDIPAKENTPEPVFSSEAPQLETLDGLPSEAESATAELLDSGGSARVESVLPAMGQAPVLFSVPESEPEQGSQSTLATASSGPAQPVRRRGQFNTGTLSIADEHAKQNASEEVFIPQANTPFSLPQVQESVLAFSQDLSTQGKMVAAQMLSRVEVEQKSPTSLVFYIPHAGLQTTFGEISAEVLQHLRTALKNDFIELSSEIKPTEQTAKPYTAEEKFNAMAETNPSLLDLKNAFNFEIKS